MSRLTDRTNSLAFVKNAGVFTCKHICAKEDYKCRECPIQEVFEKLAHYEDLEEAGRLIEVISCRNCKRHENSSSTEGFGWCDEYECITADDGYCSRAVDKLAELKGGAE